LLVLEAKRGTFSGLLMEDFRCLLSGKEGNLRAPSKEDVPTCPKKKGESKAPSKEGVATFS
jgi:hypothetical protein